MGLIITLIFGGIIVWLASIVMRTDAQQGILLNVVVGIVGAFLGNFLGSFFGMGASLDTFSPIGLLWAFIGAVVLLGIINLIRRGSVRRSEEHTSELQSLMRISYAVFCLKKKK